MESTTPGASPSKAARWTGRAISAIIVAMLVMSGVMKFTNSPQLTEGMAHLGWPVKLAIALGVLELTCTILYAIPQTSVLGAILLTGYLGGAIATHVRIGEPVFIHIGIGVFIWLGLCLRDPRLWALIPLRR